MAFNHKFLATKSWHVRTPRNIATVEAAEASAASLSRRVEQRKAILAKERALQATQALRLSNGHQGKSSAQAGPIVPTATSVAFMYEPPPGFVAVEEPEAEPEILPTPAKEEDIKPFISQSIQSSATPSAAASAPLLYNAPPPADGVAIESYAERRERHKNMTPQQIRDELHPALKGAPVTADYVREGAFRPNPLGVIVRDVRCLRCGGIGHASGDRECPKFAQPSLLDAQAIARDDPVTKLKALAEQQQQQRVPADSSAAASSHVPLPPSSRSSANGKFKLMYNDEDWTAGGLGKDDPLQQVLLANDDDDGLDPRASSERRSRKRSKHETSSSSNLPAEEAAFLASLSEADMKLLLKQYKQARKGSRKSGSDSSSSNSGDSSSSSSSSGSDSDSDSSISSSDSSPRRRSSKRKKHHKRSKKAKKTKSSKSDRHHRSSHSSSERDSSRKHESKQRKKKRKRSRSASPQSKSPRHALHHGRSELTAHVPNVAASALTNHPSFSTELSAPALPATNLPAPSAASLIDDDLPPLLPY